MGIIDTIIDVSVKIYQTELEGLLFNITLAIVILLLGFVVGKLVGKIVTKLLHEFELNKLMKSAGIKRPLEGPLGSLVSYLIYFITVIMALNQLQIVSIVLYIILITIIIIIIISFMLSVKDFLPNFFAGLFIFRHGLIKEGDYIKVNDTQGKITHISLMETQLETKEKDIVFIPNTLLTKNKVIKLSSKRLK
jgi:small conductance mechanosensitive channel